MHNSWSIKEVSPDPGGLPRYPLKSVILLCFVLLLAQGVAELVKEVRVLRGGDGGTTGASDETDEGEEGHDAPARPGGV